MLKTEMRNKDHFKKGLVDLIKYTNIKDIKMIEIGSFSGESCEIFLSTGLIYNIICIDPWKNNWSEMSSKYNMEEVESIFDERFRNNEHVLKYKGDINSFCEKYVLNNDIDIVYIDGNHSYEYVKNDILKTLNYIKPKYISCHDYFENNSNEYLSGVYNAVNEIIGLPDNIFCDHSWIKKI